ncbi:mitochondrial ribosomal protein L42 [Lasioglossum baleicum]|uniref:mitochondrial ribosomal protein L42 n=1 Tax=Lasioglossum baleicum TaxID=434251 RepID=UPI003FCDAF8B
MNRVLCVARVLKLTCRQYSSSAKLPPELVIPLNKEMIVCWHPEKEFPYEYSLPLPEEKELPSNSVLCIGKKEISDTFYKERRADVIEKLAKITYTQKHRWYPEGKEKRRRRRGDQEREYL